MKVSEKNELLQPTCGLTLNPRTRGHIIETGKPDVFSISSTYDVVSTATITEPRKTLQIMEGKSLIAGKGDRGSLVSGPKKKLFVGSSASFNLRRDLPDLITRGTCRVFECQ